MGAAAGAAREETKRAQENTVVALMTCGAHQDSTHLFVIIIILAVAVVVVVLSSCSFCLSAGEICCNELTSLFLVLAQTSACVTHGTRPGGRGLSSGINLDSRLRSPLCKKKVDRDLGLIGKWRILSGRFGQPVSRSKGWRI